MAEVIQDGDWPLGEWQFQRVMGGWWPTVEQISTVDKNSGE